MVPYPRAVVGVVNRGDTKRPVMKMVNGGTSSDATRRSIGWTDNDAFKFPCDGGCRSVGSTAAGPLPNRRKPRSWGRCATSELMVVSSYASVGRCRSSTQCSSPAWTPQASLVTEWCHLDDDGLKAAPKVPPHIQDKFSQLLVQLGFAGNHAWFGSRILIHEGFSF
jgi:hypothetical protein